MYSYKTSGVCSRQIDFDVDDNGVVHNVVFHGGCMGNTTGVSKLVEGMKVEEIIKRLEGIKCRPTTSCPDQLAKALKQYLENKNN